MGADASAPDGLGSVHLARGHGRFIDIGSTAIFLQQDPLAEKYYNLSPYAYCANSPVNFVDPDGRSWYYNSDTGEAYRGKNIDRIKSI